MAFSHSPRIVSDGLMLYLDVGNTKSYRSGSTSWFNLAQNNISGSFVNTLTYDSSNGGSLLFGGSGYVTYPMSGVRPTSQLTSEFWVSLTANTTQVFIGAQYGASTDNSYALWLEPANQINTGINVGAGMNVMSTGITLNTGRYYQFVHTFDGSNQRLYVNGSLSNTKATSGTIVYDTNNTLLAIGADFNSGYNGGALAPVFGRVPMVRIYSRALVVSEILQNYNTGLRRLGI